MLIMKPLQLPPHRRNMSTLIDYFLQKPNYSEAGFVAKSQNCCFLVFFKKKRGIDSAAIELEKK